MKYASIVPLIGGETIAMQNVTGQRPEYILSYEAFGNNDSHLLNYYNHEVPYHVLDKEPSYRPEHVDVVNTVCPCAGLSMLSRSASSDASANDWMRQTSEFVLEHINPTVFWGENAPALASNMGAPVVNDLRKIGKKYGYTFSIYKTRSLLHGLSQVRNRTFYFFWKGDKVPLFDYYNRKPESIVDLLRSVKNDPNDPMAQILTNNKKPSEDPYYRYVLEELNGGMTHQEFIQSVDKSYQILNYIDKYSNHKKVGDWMAANGYDNEVEKSYRRYKKLNDGGQIMKRGIEIPKDKIGAFVGHYPTALIHPDEDRFLTVREALSVMKMPEDFQLLKPKQNLNHICQNVPVTTAQDMADNVVRFVNGRMDNRLIETDYLLQDNTQAKVDYERAPNSLEEFFAA